MMNPFFIKIGRDHFLTGICNRRLIKQMVADAKSRPASQGDMRIDDKAARQKPIFQHAAVGI
jgi:hypothetical protein